MTDNDDPDRALAAALQQLLGPLARLCVDGGVGFPAAQELMKLAFVHAARTAHGQTGAQRDISLVSVATGLTRREVTRLGKRAPAAATMRMSPATRVFTRWISDRALRDRRGRPRVLPRQGGAPSFESLAQSVTRDVHPRALLDELCRLGLTRVNDADDSVSVLQQAFSPRNDRTRVLGFLGANVGDHLSAAVENVREGPHRHFEQALYADELSRASVSAVNKLVQTQWRQLMTALVPRIEAMIEADGKSTRPAGQRLRIGLYMYDETRSDASDSSEETT